MNCNIVIHREKKQQTQVAEKLLKQLFCLTSGHKERQKFGNLI